MLVEYKIRFLEDGVTITQRVEPESPGSAAVTPLPTGAGALTGQSLGSQFPPGKGGGGEGNTGPGGGGEGNTGPGGGGEDNTGPGGGGPGRRPIVILGPIVVGPPSLEQSQDGRGQHSEKIVPRSKREQKS